MKRRTEVIETLRQWLLSKNQALDPLTLSETTDIIETRALDSLELVEFILFLEQESGRSILVETLEPEVLRTLSRIHHTFFEEHS